VALFPCNSRGSRTYYVLRITLCSYDFLFVLLVSTQIDFTRLSVHWEYILPDFDYSLPDLVFTRSEISTYWQQVTWCNKKVYLQERLLTRKFTYKNMITKDINGRLTKVSDKYMHSLLLSDSPKNVVLYCIGLLQWDDIQVRWVILKKPFVELCVELLLY